MKKTVLFSLLLAATVTLTSACGEQEVLPNPLPAETTAAATQAATQAPTESPVTILDGAENLGGGLWYIPNGAVEAATWPTLESFRGNLLLCQPENSDGFSADLHMTLIDSRTGQTLAETSPHLEDYQMPKALENSVACVSGDERVTITFLNEKLEESSSLTVDGPCPNCYLSPDGHTLYMLSSETGITALNLSDGTRRELLTDAANLYSFAACGPYVPVIYDDLATSMRLYASLNLETGALEPAPWQEACGRFTRWNDIWHASDYNDPTYSLIGTDDHPDYLHLDDGELQLLEQGKLLGRSYLSGALSIYDPDGTCLSSVVLPENLSLLTNVAPIWSDALGGYFLLATTNDTANCRLLFWDLSEPSEPGEDLSLISWEQMHTPSGGESADPSLYARAEAISRQYGVTVSIADQCTHEFPDFSYEQLTDSDTIIKGLTCIEQALSCYPEGFLSQLPYGTIRDVQIYLAAGLKGGEYFGEDRSYYGFANENGSVYYIVLDADIIREGNLFHEISHIIDRKLAYDASLRTDARYSESGWMDLQPEGFDFCYDYSGIPPLSQSYFRWFIDDYSQSYPTEDRARIMEYAMMADRWQDTFSDAPHLVAKLQYYSDCIRDCFDTTGWPEVTRWEQALHIGD